MEKIKYIVYTSELSEVSFIINSKKAGINCIPVIDARSAVYVATGICAQNDEPVLVCINSSNASRSAFSGMTEAFYRKLPVVLITFGQELDYSKELKDVVTNHHVVSTENEIEQFLCEDFPIHIEVLSFEHQIKRVKCNKIQTLLCSLLETDKYLYVGQGIKYANEKYRCKVVHGGMPNCHEGALANVLGASLAQKKNRYIGLVSEEEFLHDINTLGNININDLLFYIVLGFKENKAIIDYARSLSFEVDSVKEGNLNEKHLDTLLNNRKKSFLMVYKEE